MGARYGEFILLLAVCTLAHCVSVNKTAKKNAKDSESYLYQYEDYDAAEDQEVLFSEDKPCPRDCICTVSQGYRIAKCNRLEVGTQKFGDDITDLVIENADPRFPIELPDFIFKTLGLHRVATIKIVNSTIGSVGPKAFHDLNELYAVNLSNNKLKYLRPETFTNNKKLLLLTLANNPLKFPATGSQEYFLNASSVQELDVSYCNMQYVTANTFKYMPGLMYLNMAGNTLSEIDPDTFRKLLDLEELDLSDNNIKALPDDIFSENVELATLHIQRNPIDTVYGLQISDLLTLNAGQTKIKFIGPSMFNGMTYIANLNLSGNAIEKIHNQAFRKLVELNYLDLSYNNLDFMSSILIEENIELDVFKISNNPRLKHLPADGFNCSADQFNIYLFEAANCGLEEIYDDSLKTFTALSQVNLSGNKIKSINSRVFSRCSKLVDINLSYNELTILDVKIFEKNAELAKLNLQGNPLILLSAEIFVHTPVLNNLDISNADLTYLWKADKNLPAKFLSNLSFLNVSHNRISGIKQAELDKLNKLQTLSIDYNPIICNREFENLMTWLSKHKVSPTYEATIANLAKDSKDGKEVGFGESWETLQLKTCGNIVRHPVEPLPSISDEEIWERIDKDEAGNFDLKDTLDDDKVVESQKPVAEVNGTKRLNDNDADDENDLEDDTPDDQDDGDDDDDDDEDDSTENYDDDVELKYIELKDKTKLNGVPVPKEEEDTVTHEKVKIDLNLLEIENNRDTLEPRIYEATIVEEHGRYEYLWPILIVLLGALLLLIIVAKVVMVLCSRRNKQIRYNSAIIAAMSHQCRTKKDCGQVYQQLTEDLTGPATPKLNRYFPLHSVTVKASNLSYESSPFHHNNIVPEAV